MYNLDKCDCCGVDKYINFEKCEFVKCEDICTSIDDTGRLLFVNVKITNLVCSSKIAVGVILYDKCKIQGFKVEKIDVEHDYDPYCTDLDPIPFCFVLPDKSLCDEKELKIKVISNYIDINCC